MNQLDELTSILAREGAESLGCEHGRPGSALASALLRPAARSIAREFVLLDAVLATRTLPDAARWALDHFAAAVETAGLDHVPRRGPILLVANHPGLTDAVALIAALDRDDVRIVAADYPFLRAMRGLTSRLIFLRANGTSQLTCVRAASRHLRQGGVVLLFPAGRLEPDPAVRGQAGTLLPWSDSLGLIARLAPETQVVPAAVSGVLSSRAFAHPLTRIRRTPRDRQRVATLLQMMDAGYRRVVVRIAFGTPLESSGDPNAEIVTRMGLLLMESRLNWSRLVQCAPGSATTAA